jgi:hypothetical protein
MSADAVVEDGVAQGIVDAIVAQGKELEKVLLETGIVTGRPGPATKRMWPQNACEPPPAYGRRWT